MAGASRLPAAPPTERQALPVVPGADRHQAALDRFCETAGKQLGRRVTYWALARNRSAVGSYFEGSKLILPRFMVTPLAPPVVQVLKRHHGERDEAVRQDVAALPDLLDRIDVWLARSVLGGSPPNVADYQVATSLALLMTHDDLRPVIAARPAGELARRLAPDLPGRLPPAFPREWL